MNEKFVTSVEANQQLQQQLAQKDSQLVASEESARTAEAASGRIVDDWKVYLRLH